jgi:quercetin dioxygenase-like cupin family protein
MEKAIAYIPPGEGTRSLWLCGELLTYKIPSQHTGGAYALFEVTTQPGSGPPPHVQHREDESFYVLGGQYEFLLEGSALRAGPGSLLYVPKGIMHVHKNIGEGVAKMLVTQTPGGLYELFFEEVGKPAADDAGPLLSGDHLDVAGIRAIAAEYGIEIPPTIEKES